jgi:excisionase family DNA binding protein
MLTVQQASKTLNVSPSTIRAWILQRKIMFVKMGRCVRVPRQVINELINKGTIPASSNGVGPIGADFDLREERERSRA